ncbi:MAG: D-glycero-beta-D-manno-heptose-7-phosphate kinase [Candidatus Omnitrophota bacterium]|nr:MAG: D-glycero-beta-D-manno-heptose-7-phosphate kinase [Candidatus Omnitrophota bacterium]
MKVDKKRLKSIISRFKNKRILVVGDLILDHYIFGKVDKISPEGPVPVVWAREENFVCGGAANVGLNLCALGAGVSLCGVLGRDHFGSVVFSLIKKKGIDTGLIVREKNRPTTLKTRIIAHNQQVVRVDWESIEFLSLETNKLILNKVRKHIDNFDAIIIEDYGKGVINPALVGELVNLCKQKKKIVTVDPKEEHFDYYENVTVLTPNLKEAQVAANMKVKSKEELFLLGKIIMGKLKPQALLVTLGEEGMMLFYDGGRHHIPTATLEVFDVTGAGDTVIATYTNALSCGASYLEAAIISNFAAGVVVGKLGAAAITKKELFKKIDESKLG